MPAPGEAATCLPAITPTLPYPLPHHYLTVSPGQWRQTVETGQGGWNGNGLAEKWKWKRPTTTFQQHFPSFPTTFTTQLPARQHTACAGNRAGSGIIHNHHFTTTTTHTFTFTPLHTATHLPHTHTCPARTCTPPARTCRGPVACRACLPPPSLISPLCCCCLLYACTALPLHFSLLTSASTCLPCPCHTCGTLPPACQTCLLLQKLREDQGLEETGSRVDGSRTVDGTVDGQDRTGSHYLPACLPTDPYPYTPAPLPLAPCLPACRWDRMPCLYHPTTSLPACLTLPGTGLPCLVPWVEILPPCPCLPALPCPYL